jgi:hypothetical protein
MSELLNVATVAAILKVSPDTVVRRFSKMKGVVNLGSEETRGKRRYRVIRIPTHVLERYVGHPITIPAPKPKSRKKSNDPLWIVEASQNLAKAVNENAGDNARAVFETIAFNARTLTFVPEEDWSELEFIEGEEWQ